LTCNKESWRKKNQMVSGELYANLIIWHVLPFKFVKYWVLRTWISYLNLDVTIIFENTIKSDIFIIFMKEKKNMVKEELNNFTNRICLTLDLWTSCTTEGYINLTMNHIDSSWKLSGKIIFVIYLNIILDFELSEKINDFLSYILFDVK